ncbi:MAG TPA: class I SAM-dependent methyltransferase [Solirubrobacterales bacterium]|nr:class I SAM-dependent methyltransferase [Solirubrobacterales bacterium]
MRGSGGDRSARRDTSADELEATYRGYAASGRKRRSWSASNRGNVEIRAELLDAVLELGKKPLAGRGEILDIGCGSGWLLAEFAARGVERRRLHGVDLIEARVAAARERVPGVDVRLADDRSLQFQGGQFELITMLTTLSSAPSRESLAVALREARRVLSPSGVILCYEPWLPNPFNRQTTTISTKTLSAFLGPTSDSRRLTGFPPLARRLGPLAPRLYPALARLVPTHRVTVHRPGDALRSRG